MLHLTTHEHVQIYTETLFALARDARAARNDAALAFVGSYLKKLVPERALEAFRDELRRLPAQPAAEGATCAVANSYAAHKVVEELETYQAERDKDNYAKPQRMAARESEEVKCAEFEF